MSSDHSILMPPPAQEGGLIKMPKKNPEVADHQFKVPESIGKQKLTLCIRNFLNYFCFN